MLKKQTLAVKHDLENIYHILRNKSNSKQLTNYINKLQATTHSIENNVVDSINHSKILSVIETDKLPLI